MQNGKVYTHLHSDRELDEQYFRQSGSKIYSYDPYYQTERAWYDFSKTTNDTVGIVYGPYDTTTITVAYQEMISVFGMARLSWAFYETWSPLSFYALREVTDSVGLTYYQYEPGMVYELSGAILNGVQYGMITEVNLKARSGPQAFRLSQNYPNPFNPSTTIHFELPKASIVHLELFNILGQSVMQILDEKREAGTYDVPVRAGNLSSGVYFYRLAAGDFVQTRKMVLTR